MHENCADGCIPPKIDCHFIISLKLLTTTCVLCPCISLCGDSTTQLTRLEPSSLRLRESRALGLHVYAQQRFGPFVSPTFSSQSAVAFDFCKLSEIFSLEMLELIYLHIANMTAELHTAQTLVGFVRRCTRVRRLRANGERCHSA